MANDSLIVGQEIIIYNGGDSYELAEITGETATQWKVGQRRFYKQGASKYSWNDWRLIGGHGIKIVGKPTPELRKKVATTLQNQPSAQIRRLLEEAEMIATKWDSDTGQEIIREPVETPDAEQTEEL